MKAGHQPARRTGESFFGKVQRGVRYGAIVFGLMVLQVVLALVGYRQPVIGALHGINALSIIAIAGTASRLPARETAPVASE